MADFHVAVGDRATFSKTVSESDVYLFAGITGDLSPNHVDRAYMERSSFGERIAHGALLIGYMSTASSMIVAGASEIDETPVSLGYDRVRFVGPVFIGDTITVEYTVDAVDVERRRSTASIEIVKQDGTLVAVANHVLKWVPNASG